jgi:hypothetical protein
VPHHYNIKGCREHGHEHGSPWHMSDPPRPFSIPKKEPSMPVLLLRKTTISKLSTDISLELKPVS